MDVALTQLRTGCVIMAGAICEPSKWYKKKKKKKQIQKQHVVVPQLPHGDMIISSVMIHNQCQSLGTFSICLTKILHGPQPAVETNHLE